MIVVGVDGCKKGWVVAAWDTEEGTISLSQLDNFEMVLQAFPKDEVNAIAIDIPIGLIDCHRAADREARKVLGRRGVCVFPSPDPRIVEIEIYAEANAESRRLCGKGVPKQAFGIFPKVAEVNHVMTPELQSRVVEVHPEVCFWAMAKEPIQTKKSKLEGYEIRQSVLTKATGCTIWDKSDLRALLTRERKVGKLMGVEPDDVLDAIAGTWTARRWVDGKHRSFPKVPEINQDGLRAEIVY